MRTCIGCNGRFDRFDGGLRRVTIAKDGSLVAGVSHPGRGAWICAARPQCIDNALRRRAFPRALRASIDPEALAQFLARFSEEVPNVRD